MEIKIKNYVVSESKSYSFVVRNVTIERVTNLIRILVSSGALVSFNMNRCSNVVSFSVLDLECLSGYRSFIERYFNFKR